MTAGALAAAAGRLLASRTEQGFPGRVQDPTALAAIAASILAQPGQKKTAGASPAPAVREERNAAATSITE